MDVTKQINNIAGDIISRANKMGFDKIAVQMLNKKGYNLNAETLDIPQAVAALGTKLAMIKKDRDRIIFGLTQLAELNK